MGIPLGAGRAFLPTDDATHPRVAIVSAAFARGLAAYFPARRAATVDAVRALRGH
jgi:ABC-type lipoprotein release transport system permease subunit